MGAPTQAGNKADSEVFPPSSAAREAEVDYETMVMTQVIHTLQDAGEEEGVW